MRRSPDHELILLARKGSTKAAEALFDRYWTYAWRAAYAVTADRSLADDAAQEGMEKAFGFRSTASTNADVCSVAQTFLRSPSGRNAESMMRFDERLRCLSPRGVAQPG